MQSMRSVRAPRYESEFSLRIREVSKTFCRYVSLAFFLGKSCKGQCSVAYQAFGKCRLICRRARSARRGNSWFRRWFCRERCRRVCRARVRPVRQKILQVWHTAKESDATRMMRCRGLSLYTRAGCAEFQRCSPPFPVCLFHGRTIQISQQQERHVVPRVRQRRVQSCAVRSCREALFAQRTAWRQPRVVRRVAKSEGGARVYAVISSKMPNR